MIDRVPGDLVRGRYRVVRELGRGGHGVTWEADDLERGQRVAVKVLRLATVDHWGAVRRFEREARALRGIDHPGVPAYVELIAPTTDAAADGTADWILVQSLAPGRPLDALLAEGWRPDEATACDIARRVLLILAHLHGRPAPIVHRDLKPANLIRGDLGHVWLVDFGSVRDTLLTASRSVSVTGTYGYMAPEQFQGRAEPRSDLYGLGATLVHLLAGTPPADLPHTRLELDVARAVRVTARMRRFLERLLAPALEDRFGSAADALRALDAVEQRGRALAWSSSRAPSASPGEPPPAPRPDAALNGTREDTARVAITADEGSGETILTIRSRGDTAEPHSLARRAFAVALFVLMAGVTFEMLTGPARSGPGLIGLLVLAAFWAAGARWIWSPQLVDRRRTTLRLGPRGFVIARDVAGFATGVARGRRGDVVCVDRDCAVGDGEVPFRSVALVTRGRSHVLGVGLDAEDAAAIEAAVAAWRDRP